MEADFEAGRTHVALAEVRRMRGDRAGAAAALGEARALFDRLGLAREVDAVDRLAAAPAGAAVARRGGRRRAGVAGDSGETPKASR
jgi:hypothetical protein